MATPVSIVIPCYNAERYLAQALDSTLAQTHAEFEVVAVNDGSTDSTPDILETYRLRDRRVSVLSHPNYGISRSLNEAMEKCRHEWVARMDSDDVMMPNRLERQLAFVAENPDLVVASSLVQYINSRGDSFGRYRTGFTSRAEVARAVSANEVVGFHHPAALMRRSVIRSVGGYRSQFNGVEDTELWNRVAELDPRNPALLVQPEYLLKYRIHGGSVCVAQARLSARKLEWATLCMQRRRAGKREPEFEEYLRERRLLPWTSRFNLRRRETAWALYKSASLHYANGSYVRVLPVLLCAGLLEPGHIVSRVAARISGRPRSK